MRNTSQITLKKFFFENTKNKVQPKNKLVHYKNGENHFGNSSTNKIKNKNHFVSQFKQLSKKVQ